jgi:phospholipid/cholesterol/gamma-HCH transport system substrate-binding protein
VIDRANPALRQTDRVLAILAQQNQQLASLASNGDTVLAPLARNRAHITSFFHNAAISGQATAERSADLEEGLQKLPATLHQIRLTSTKLKDFADQGTPLFADLNTVAPGLNKATINLPKFAQEGIPALQTLGTAAQAAGPKLAASDGMLSDLAGTASSAVPVGNNFAALLSTFEKTQGFQSLMSFIYNTTGSLNGFDHFGHFQRSNLQLSTCVEIVSTPAGGCEAFFSQGATAAPKTKKKKGKKAKVSKAKARLRSASPLPQVNVPNIQDLIPQLTPDQGQITPDRSGSGSSSGSDTTTTPQGDQQNKQTPDGRDVSMNEASMFLQFLLGGGA